MAKGGGLSKFMAIVLWIVAVLVTLSVGFAMIEGVLSLPSWLGGATMAGIVGWIVVVLTFLGVILAIIDAFSK